MKWRQLKHYCDGPPQYGLNVGADEYTTEGVRLLRTTDIGDDGSLTPASEGVCVPPELVEGRYRAKPGDLLFSRAGSLGRCLRVQDGAPELTFAGYLVRFRPGGEADPRYLKYCASSAFFQSGIEADAITSTISNFNAERYGNLRLPNLGLRSQRAIADFLDTETARIDALITKKRRMVDVLSERLATAVHELLLGTARVPLRRVSKTLAGYTFPSERFGPEMSGPRLLRGINIAPGSIRWDEVVRLGDDGHDLRRYELDKDDVVVGMDRPFVGGGTRVAVVDEDSAGALLVQRVCRIRARTPAEAVLIRWALAGDGFRTHVEADLTGVSVPHLSEEQIATFPVPAVDAGAAAELAQRMRWLEVRHRRVRIGLSTQIQLLQEHREALITAAVTGELEVPGVAA